MKRKGAYDGQLLSLEGIYELSSKPEIVRVLDSAECIWDFELCRGEVTKERGKHLHSMGVRLRRSAKTLHSDRIDQNPDTLGIAPTLSLRVTEQEEGSDPGSLIKNSQPTQTAQLYLYPEEVLLLVEQGSIILR